MSSPRAATARSGPYTGLGGKKGPARIGILAKNGGPTPEIDAGFEDFRAKSPVLVRTKTD